MCLCVCIGCVSCLKKKSMLAFRPGLYGEKAGVIVDSKQGNIILYQVNLYIQLLPIFYFLCLFKSTNSCLKCLDILCVHAVHTPTQQAYSVLHLAIQLSYLLVLLGLFYIYITYVKQ